MLDESEILTPDPDPEDAYALDRKSVLQVLQAIEDGDSAAAEAAMRRHTRRGRFQRIALLTQKPG